ncbi:MAG: hypothetical protein AAB634_03770, partial [Patescibacteria group bacterium]
MRIIVSVPGRFHGFELARELQNRGHLTKLVTSYPKSEAEKYGVPKEKICSILLKEILQRGWKKLPFIKNWYNPYPVMEFYDRLAAGYLSEGDLCIAFSGAGLHTMRK